MEKATRSSRERVKLEVRLLKSEELLELEALVGRRRQLMEMLTAERNRLGIRA